MTNLIKIQPTADTLERVLLQGDLSTLGPEERIQYYRQTCESLGLNWLTKPFEYIKLNGKLTLYARKDATDQLRKLNGVSIGKPDIQDIGGNFVVTVTASDKFGRQDADVGVVSKTDMGGNFGNALMKAITKAKRRVTLSICGLGMLDETEVETIPNAQVLPAEIGEGSAIVTESDPKAEQYKRIGELQRALQKEDREFRWTREDLAGFAVELGLPSSALDASPEQLDDLIGHLEAALDDARHDNILRDSLADTTLSDPEREVA